MQSNYQLRYYSFLNISINFGSLQTVIPIVKPAQLNVLLVEKNETTFSDVRVNIDVNGLKHKSAQISSDNIVT